jgi:hypothetical protein
MLLKYSGVNVGDASCLVHMATTWLTDGLSPSTCDFAILGPSQRLLKDNVAGSRPCAAHNAAAADVTADDANANRCMESYRSYGAGSHGSAVLNQHPQHPQLCVCVCVCPRRLRVDAAKSA